MFCEKLIFDLKNPARANQVNNFFFCDYCSSITDANQDLLETLDYVYNDIQPFLGLQQKLIRYFIYFKIKLYIAIITITVITSFMFLVLIDVSASLNSLRYNYFYQSPILMILSGSFFAVLATGLCGTFAHTAEGSGIPELKTVFSGTNYYNFLSMQTLWVKYFASLFVKLSGLGMGYEGSFIHIQAIMGHHLLKLPYFRDLHCDHNEKMLISAGVCSAIVMAFGTPIGALFFTIEMYTSNFKVTNLIKYFISATISYTMFLVLQRAFLLRINVPIRLAGYFYIDLHYFVLLGVLQGLISSAYLATFSRFLLWKRNFNHPICTNRYFYAAFVAAVIAIFSYPHDIFKFGFRAVLNDLINLESLLDQSRQIQWWYDNYCVIFELIYVLFVRIMMMFAFSSAAIPFGLFGPGTIVGTLFGRIYGELLKSTLGISTSSTIFAISGAPAFVCAITRSFSPLICVIEISGELNLFFPMLITVTVSFIVSSIFSISFYDMTIAIRKLPYLASILPPQKAAMKAKDVMMNILHDSLSAPATLFDIFELLSSKVQIFDFDYIPIVDPKSGKLLKYVKLKDCYNFLKYYQIQFDPILAIHKDTISRRLFTAIKGFLRENNLYVSEIISKQIRSHIHHIEFKDGKFIMNSLAKNTERVAKELQIFRRSTLYTQKSIKNRDTARNTRNTPAFRRDTVGQEKDFQTELKCDFQLLKELLHNVDISFEDKRFHAEDYPILVNEETSMLKVHYLFLMLQVEIIWVENSSGRLVGKITKDVFLEFKAN